jgi:hypothetical protein
MAADSMAKIEYSIYYRLRPFVIRTRIVYDKEYLRTIILQTHDL